MELFENLFITSGQEWKNIKSIYFFSVSGPLISVDDCFISHFLMDKQCIEADNADDNTFQPTLGSTKSREVMKK